MAALAEIEKELQRFDFEIEAAWQDAEGRLEGVRRAKLGDLNLRDNLYQEMKPVFRRLCQNRTLRSAFFRADGRGRWARRLLLVFMSELVYWEYERSFWKKLYEVLDLEGKASEYHWFTTQMLRGYRENGIALIRGWGGRREYVRTIIGESGFSRQLVQEAKRFVIWFFDNYSSLDPRRLDAESFDKILDSYLERHGDLNKEDLFDLLRDMVNCVGRLLREIRKQYLVSADLRDPQVLTGLKEGLGFHPIRGIFGFRKREDIQELLEQLSRRMRPNTFRNHLQLKARQGLTLRISLPSGDIVEVSEPASVPILFGEYQIVAPSRSTVQVVPKEALSIGELAERIERRKGVFHEDGSRYAWFCDDRPFEIHRGSSRPRKSLPFNIAGQRGHLWYGRRMIGVSIKAVRSETLLDELAPRRDVRLNPRVRLNGDSDSLEVVIPSFVCYEPEYAGCTVRLELNGRPIEETTYVLDRRGTLEFQGTRRIDVLPDDRRLEVALVTLRGQTVTSHTVYASLERSFLFDYAREVVPPGSRQRGGQDYKLFAIKGRSVEAGPGVSTESAGDFGHFQIWHVHWEYDMQDPTPFHLKVGGEQWEIGQPLEVFLSVYCATHDGLFRPQEPNSAYEADDIYIRVHLKGGSGQLTDVRSQLLLIIEKDEEFITDFTFPELGGRRFLLQADQGGYSSQLDLVAVLDYLLGRHLISHRLGSYRLTLLLRETAGEVEQLSEVSFFLLPRLSVMGHDDFVAEGVEAEVVVYGSEPVLSGDGDLPTNEVWLSFVPRATFNAKSGQISACSVRKTVRLNYPPVKVGLDFVPRIFACRLLLSDSPVGRFRLSQTQLSEAGLQVLAMPGTLVHLRLDGFERALTADSTGHVHYDLRNLGSVLTAVRNVVHISSRGLEKHFEVVWYPDFCFEEEKCYVEETASGVVLHIAGKASGPPGTRITFQATHCFRAIGSITMTIAEFQLRQSCCLALDPDMSKTAGWVYCIALTERQRLREIKIEFRDLATALEHLNEKIDRTESADFQLLLERSLVLRDLGRLPEATDDLQRCFCALDEATSEQILVVRELLQEMCALDGEWARCTLKAVSIKMFALHRLESAIRASETGSLSANGLERYLQHLPETSSIPCRVLERLLAVGQFEFRVSCARRLLARKSETAVVTVIEWASESRLAKDEAFDILDGADPVFVLRCLPKSTSQEWIEHFLAKAESQAPKSGAAIVRPKTRIQCDAGWGRVERIEDDNGHQKLFCFADDRDVKLYVTLRPESDSEPVVLNTASGRIHFTEATEVYTCAKCNRFSASNPNLILGVHNREVHGGLGPSYRPERTRTRHLTFIKSGSPAECQ